MTNPTPSCFGGALISLLFLVSTPPATAQVNWTAMTPTTAPSPRAGQAMAYDSARQLVVLFGGGDPASVFADTWEWNGSDWLERQNLSTAPSARGGHEVAYDSTRHRLVLFGGWDGAADLGDTWEFDGTTWTRVATTGPAPRRAHAMCYDPVRQKVVLFGGAFGSTTAPGWLGDTWEWNGRSWVQINAAGPAGRWGTGMVFDPPSGRVLMFGGAGQWMMNDTWEFDGATWTQLFPASAPPPKGEHDMAFIPSRGRMVVFGGANGAWAPTAETWEWDGANWEQRFPQTRPPSRWDNPTVYDAARGRVVMFGGHNGGNLGDTWCYSKHPTASFTPFGNGCAGSAGTPKLAAAYGRLPWIGSVFTVELTSLPSGFLNVPFVLMGSSRTQWGATPLPIDLGFMGMPGCPMSVSPDLSFTVVNQAGRAELSLLLPNEAPLLGTSFYLQGMVVDPTANAFGLTVSNAGEARIGGR